MATVVTTPDGGRWRVGRRWVPWRFRLRKPRSPLDDIELPLDIAVPFDGIFVIVGVVVAALAFGLLMVPVVIALVELTILVPLVAVGVLVRLLLRRPWIVDVERLDAYDRAGWEVVGWRRSGRLVTALATQLRSGQPLTGLPGATRCD
ncbi:MAG: hypothetical protein KY443_11240 [Actinobacteria bacterium]|nr:hypothetical protein [Actinomycetota bacterium]